MKATFKKPKPEKRDYFVPDLGEDEDTRDTKENLGNAEEELGHTLDAENLLPPQLPPPPPRDYSTPEAGEDTVSVKAKANLKKLREEDDN